MASQATSPAGTQGPRGSEVRLRVPFSGDHRQVGSWAGSTFPCRGSLDGGKCRRTRNPPPITGPSCHTPSACRDLSWNAIRSIHPEAFATLRSLVKL